MRTIITDYFLLLYNKTTKLAQSRNFGYEDSIPKCNYACKGTKKVCIRVS